MKLYNALDLGRNCGLETVSEAILNVEIHCSNLFSYDEMDKEFDELYSELEDYIIIGGSFKDNVNEAMKKLEKAS
jgi:hypothetical protein